MGEHTFTLWLHNEVACARCALLTLYEQRDTLRFIEGPRLKKDYMDKIGAYEETVIQEEIECELLKKKQQMIQTALNRREPIDEAAIDAELENHRRQMLLEAAGSAARDHAELSDEKSNELQTLHRDIVQNFHPQMHPELTEVHRQLFQKAQEAYRRGDLEALKLVRDMLYSTQENGMAQKALLELLVGNKTDEKHEEESAPKRDYATDYSLAAMIYCAFKPTNEEAAIQQKRTRYHQMADSIMKEMDDMRLQFPYTAADMLSDPAKIEFYKEKLAHRLYTAANEREHLTKEIQTMIEGVAIHE